MAMFDDKVQKQYDALSARFVVLLSFVLQVLLTVYANTRKTRRRRVMVTALIWMLYQCASWVAAFAMGLISSGQKTNDVDSQLAILWASCLLLHLGGPDNMTAFSLDDNESWTRQLFGLLLQLTTFFYAFTESLPNHYWIPATLMLFVGAYKYTERVYSLYSASLANIRSSLRPKPDPGPNYAQFMEEYSVVSEASQVPVDIRTESEPEIPDSAAAIQSQNMVSDGSFDYTKLVVEGYNFFNDFKKVIVGHRLSCHMLNKSRKFFFSRDPVYAFRVMEVELNFMYDTLYTKYGAVYCKVGYFCRFICTALTVACFQQFASHSKPNLRSSDITFTYVLLCWAVFFDFVDMYNLVVSDWSIALAKENKVSWILVRLPFGKTTRRWSNVMFQQSFLSFCLEERRWLSTIDDFIINKDFVDKLLYTKLKNCEESLKIFIFNELKGKGEKAETAEMVKEVYSARGQLVLRDLDHDTIHNYPSISSSLSDYEVEYDESLLLWHIATEMCYLTSSGGDPNDREFCKVLSNYMLYLLDVKPTLMSPVVGIAQIRFQDTCEEARDFFKRCKSELSSAPVDQRERLACDKLLNVNTAVKPKLVKGDTSKSLLFDACILAKDLKKLGQVVNEESQWKMMSRIWVELLSYAAGHCQPDVHAQQVSQGGELITFVWLLMLHFGFGESQLQRTCKT